MVSYVTGIYFDPREPPPPGFRGPVHPVANPAPAPAPSLAHLPLPPPHPPVHVAQPSPTRSVLRPLSISLTAQIVHDTAKVSATQTFLNNTDNAIPKGAYTFPLPAGCTVIQFSCRVGSTRIVRGRAKPKSEAREAFDSAARRNQPAGLLEQDTPEIFTTTLANIPADTRLQAEITFVTLLKHRFSKNSAITTLTIPTYIASRYGTAPDFQHDPSGEPPQSLSVRIEALAAEHITSIVSKTHTVTVEMNVSGNTCQSWREFVTRSGTVDPKTALVELANGSTFLDRDFVLDITTEPQGGFESPLACIENHPSLENHNAVMITIPPKFILANQSPVHDAEVLFVADRSGSMVDKIEALKSAMKFFLHGIPQGKYFNVWCFGTDYNYLWPRSRLYSDTTLQEALSHVLLYFKADMGGTELLPALKAIVNARGGHHMTDVIMLTDGEVWRLDETIDYIQLTRRSTEGRVRFFALGIGDAVSHELVEGIAKAGGGYADVIPAANQGGWEDRAVAVLSAALTGYIGPLKIEYEGVEGQTENASRQQQLLEGSTIPIKPEFMQSPADISTLSPFLRNRIFVLVESRASLDSLKAVHIKAIMPGEDDVDIRVPIKLLTKRDSTIHKLGARALLGDLERGQSWIQLDPRSPSRNSLEEQQLTRTNGESLGCKWSLVSKWTSFYAIEEAYEAQGGARDLFLDPDDPQIHRIANNNSDLLRRRGVSGQQVRGPLNRPQTGTGTLLEGDTGDDEDSHSELDSELGSDSDSGGDDSGGSNGTDRRDRRDRGGGGTGLGRGTGGQHPGRDSSRDRTHGQGGDAADGRGNSHSGPISQERTHNLSPSPIDSPNNARNTLPASEITYTTPPTLNPSEIAARNIVSTPRTTISSRGKSDLTFRRISTSAKPSTLSKVQVHNYSYLSKTHIPNLNLSTYTPPLLDTVLSHTIPSPLPTSHPNPTSSTYTSPSTYATLSIDGKFSTDTKFSPATIPTRHHAFPFSTRPKKSHISSDKPSTTPTPLVQPESLKHGDAYSPGYMYDKMYEPTELNFDKDNTQEVSPIPLESLSWLPPARAEFSDDDREIQSPGFNPPASVWKIPLKYSALKSAQDIRNEVTVGQLINFQSSDGSFRFDSSLIEAGDLFGNSFVQAIETLQTSKLLVKYSLDNATTLAATVATIVLLETRFQSCRDLWTLMVSKARAYVDGHVSKSHREDLYKLAKDQLLLDSSKSNQDLPKMQQRLSPSLELPSSMHEDQQQTLGMLNQAESIITSPSPPRISDNATPKAAPSGDAQARSVLRRPSFLRDGMKRLRQAKREPESLATDKKKEPSTGPPFPIRRFWNGVKDLRSTKAEPKSSSPLTETLAPEAMPVKTGPSIPSSSNRASSRTSTKRSWVGQREEMRGDVKVPLTPVPGWVSEDGDLLVRRVALETVPVD